MAVEPEAVGDYVLTPVLQSRIADAAGRTFLFRVFVDVERRPAEVVTAYRTSKVAKYWRSQS